MLAFKSSSLPTSPLGIAMDRPMLLNTPGSAWLLSKNISFPPMTIVLWSNGDSRVPICFQQVCHVDRHRRGQERKCQSLDHIWLQSTVASMFKKYKDKLIARKISLADANLNPSGHGPSTRTRLVCANVNFCLHKCNPSTRMQAHSYKHVKSAWMQWGLY